MATYSAIQSDVAVWLRDLPTDTQNQIGTLINEALREAQQGHNFECMRVTSEELTVDSTRELVEIVRMKCPDGRPYLTTANGDVRLLDWEPDIRRLVRLYGPDGVGEPRYLRQGSIDTNSTTLEVWPLSDGLSDWNDGQYRITVPRFEFLPDLVSAGATNWFTFNAINYLKYATIGKASMLNLDEVRGSQYLQLAAIALAQAVRAEKDMKLRQVSHLRFRDGVYP